MHKSYHITKLQNFLLSVLFFGLTLSKAVVSICGIALFILSLLRLADKSFYQNLRSKIGIWILLLPFFIFLVSSLWSKELIKGLDFTYGQLPLLIFPLFWLSRLEAFGKRFIFYSGFFIAGLAVNCLVTICLFALPESYTIFVSEQIPIFKDYEPNINRVQFGLYSPFIVRLQFSNMIALGVSLLIYYLLHFPKRRWLWLSLLLLFLISSVMLGGRGGQLAMAAGLASWVLILYNSYLHPKLIQKIGKWQANLCMITGLLLLGIGLPLFLYTKVPAIHKRYEQLSWELGAWKNDTFRELDYVHFTALRRIISYQHNWELIKKQPVFGTGIGDYHQEMQKLYDAQDLGFPVNSHHHLLFIWASTGIIGLIAFVAMLWVWLTEIRKHSPGHPFHLAISILVVFLAIMMFDNINLLLDSVAFSLFLGGIAAFSLSQGSDLN